MNNNNMYFSCLSLIGACVSSLFANFSKVVAVCLIVCFVLCSPLAAFASTTESMMMYSMRSVDSGVMTAAVDSAQIRAISYNNVNDTYKRGTLKTITSDAIASFDAGSFTTNYISSIYNSSNYEYGIEFVFNDVSFDANGSLDLDFNGFVLMFETAGGVYPVIDFGSVYPTIAEADVTFSGIGRNFTSLGELGNTWFSFSDEVRTYPLEFNSETRILDIKGFSAPRMGGDMTLSLDTTSFIGSKVDEGSNGWQVQSANITDVTFRVLFPVEYYDLLSSSDVYYSDNYAYSTIDNQYFYTAIRFTYDLNFPKYEVTHTQGATPAGSSVGKAISSLSASVSSKISNMSTSIGNKITTSTNTITTKIDSMGSTISSGLTNVKSSIDSGLQNVQSTITSTTTEIKNTITNKVNEVKTGITEVKDSILDLPNKLQEMLTEFIVPDAETMVGKYSDFTELLEEKLGVIYQIPAMILELFETLVSGVTDPQTTLTFPSLSLPWIDGTQMKLWDSIEFEIIPTGMDVLKDLIQTVTSMVCVIMTFNSVKRIYENFLRGR